MATAYCYNERNQLIVYNKKTGFFLNIHIGSCIYYIQNLFSVHIFTIRYHTNIISQFCHQDKNDQTASNSYFKE